MVNELLICKICNKTFETIKLNHSHLRSHKIKIEEYYHKYYPRHDLLTKGLIPFDSVDQYFDTDFLSKTNLKLWLESESEVNVKKYCTDLLVKRKNNKKLFFTPTQFELRSLKAFPGILFYNKTFGDYYKFCDSIGLKNRFIKWPEKIFIDLKYLNNPEYKILVDTREQNILDLDYPIEVTKLEVGDYTLSTGTDIVIERKSLMDLICTLNAGFDRFKEEIERAYSLDRYIIVLVEEKIEKYLSFNYFDYIRRNTKCSPEFISHRIREILQIYSNVQFLFVNGRDQSSDVLKKILFSNGICKEIDCQLAYDIKCL